MEIRVLRYFLAVAREESISGAAKFLHISQPTLSRQIKELEEELGHSLFIRGNRKITLTENGRLLRKRAEEIVTLVGKTKSELSKPDDVISGEIYIGSGETEAMRLIAETAHEFHCLYPNVRYNLFSGNADDVIERLDKGLLDFGILIGATDLSKYNYIEIPATDTWGLLIRKDNPLSTHGSIKPEDLLGIPLLFSKQALNHKEISYWLGDKSDKLNIIASYNLIYNASLMVEEGIGSALCLDNLVYTGKDSFLSFKPFEPPLKAKLYIIWKKYQVFSKATAKFLEKLQKDYM
ncbi:MAG: LysR family transcriptional regulator [Clostridiales bacterium]|nr:LysR family transcriptional regulator [Clostridiales bacterium]